MADNSAFPEFKTPRYDPSLLPPADSPEWGRAGKVLKLTEPFYIRALRWLVRLVKRARDAT